MSQGQAVFLRVASLPIDERFGTSFQEIRPRIFLSATPFVEISVTKKVEVSRDPRRRITVATVRPPLNHLHQCKRSQIGIDCKGCVARAVYSRAKANQMPRYVIY